MITKVKLNVLERITLLNLLPKDGNYLTYKLLTQLKSDLSFSDNEIKKWDIRMQNDRVTWKKSEDKSIEVGESIEAMITERLKSLDKEKKINSENVSLYEKFVVGKEG